MIYDCLTQMAAFVTSPLTNDSRDMKLPIIIGIIAIILIVISVLLSVKSKKK